MLRLLSHTASPLAARPFPRAALSGPLSDNPLRPLVTLSTSMFRKANKSSTTNNNHSTSITTGNNGAYAFSGPSASISSHTARQKERENFYSPLPQPAASRSSPVGDNARSGSASQSRAYPHPSTDASVTPGGTATRQGGNGGHSGNRLLDTPPTSQGGIRSFQGSPHTPSPNPSNPLLAGASPLDSGSRFPSNTGNMPAPRYGAGQATSRMTSSAMPTRGESQSALLGNNGERVSRLWRNIPSDRPGVRLSPRRKQSELSGVVFFPPSSL